jgi:hypothetical protein
MVKFTIVTQPKRKQAVPRDVDGSFGYGDADARDLGVLDGVWA